MYNLIYTCLNTLHIMRNDLKANLDKATATVCFAFVNNIVQSSYALGEANYSRHVECKSLVEAILHCTRQVLPSRSSRTRPKVIHEKKELKKRAQDSLLQAHTQSEATASALVIKKRQKPNT